MHRFAAGRMNRIKQSGIRRVLEKSFAMEQQGQKIIHFEIGRPDFDTPELIKQAACQALDKGLVHYTLSMGLPELRQAIADDVGSRLGIEIGIDEVMITVGSSGGIINSFLITLEQGDEVIIPEPMYLFYLDWPEFFGAKTVPLPLSLEEGYQISDQALRQCISPKTKAIVLNTPHNPTGACLNRASLENVAELAQQNDLLIITDECYDRLIYEPYQHLSIASLPGMRDRTLICNSLSKTFAMDGWRLGYVIGPAELMWEMDKAQQHTVINATSFVQHAAITAVRAGEKLLSPMMNEYVARRDLVLDIVRSAPHLTWFEPEGGFYLWLRTNLDIDGWQLADTILEKAKVAITPGEVFGETGKGHIRISYSNTRENIRTGMDRVLNILDDLR